MARRAHNLLAVLIGVVAVAGGCAETNPRVVRLSEDLVERDKQIDQLRRDVARLEEESAGYRRQIHTLQELGPQRLDRLFHVVRVGLSRYTGGYGDDAPAGHDGVRVYLEPVDAAGSIIKAAGDVTIQLFDLAEPAEDSLVGQYTFDAETIGKHWYGGAFTDRYMLECPWPNSPPRHSQITVRATFVDILTGRSFTAQRVCTVKLPPTAGSQPAP